MPNEESGKDLRTGPYRFQATFQVTEDVKLGMETPTRELLHEWLREACDNALAQVAKAGRKVRADRLRRELSQIEGEEADVEGQEVYRGG